MLGTADKPDYNTGKAPTVNLLLNIIDITAAA